MGNVLDLNLIAFALLGGAVFAAIAQEILDWYLPFSAKRYTRVFLILLILGATILIFGSNFASNDFATSRSSTPAQSRPLSSIAISPSPPPLSDQKVTQESTDVSRGSVVSGTSLHARGRFRAVNIRSGPGTSFPVIGTFHKDEEVPILDWTSDASWFRIWTENGDEAWVGARVIQVVNASGFVDISTLAKVKEVDLTAPTTSITPHPVATEIRVQSTNKRSETGLEILYGQQVIIEYVSGMWRAGPLPQWQNQGADGDPQVPRKSQFPVPDKPLMGLIAGIGNGQAFWVGERIQFESAESGMLWLAANDDMYADNYGGIVVLVTLDN